MLIFSLRRLEAATSRLEDMASATIDPNASTNGVPSISPSAVNASTSDRAAEMLEPPKQVADPLPPVIDNFDSIINGDVTAFVNKSEDIGGVLAEQVFMSSIYRVKDESSSNYNIGCICPSRLCCRTQVSHSHHQVEEAGY